MTTLSKLKTTIFFIFAFGVLWTSPARANPCNILAMDTYRDSTTGAAYYSFTGSCPSGFWDSYTVTVSGDPNSPYHGSGELISKNGGPYDVGTTHNVQVYCRTAVGIIDECNTSFTVSAVETCTDDCTDDGDCAAGETCDKSCDPNGVVGDCVTPGPGPSPDEPCFVNGKEGIKTGLGCIPTDPTGLVEKILQIAIGVSSGIAMLLLIAGAFKVLTSSGDPKAVMEGRETITSAIAGLLLILLSVAILNIIGIRILGIPIWE